MICFNPYHSQQIGTMNQYFMNNPNQALAAELTTEPWFDRRFKNHYLPTRVVSTCFNHNDILQTTMNIFNRLVDLFPSNCPWSVWA